MTYPSFRKFLPIAVIATLSVAGCKTTAQWQQQQPYQANRFVVNNEVTADSAMFQYIEPYKQRLRAQMDTVIGKTAQILPRIAKDGQSLAGNFFADALLSLGQQLDSDVVCSLGTSGGIRVDIAEGDIQIGKVFELMPFENYLTVLTLKGEDLLVLGKYISKTNGQPVAGMSVTIKDQQLVSMKIKGETVDPKKTYKLVTYDYLANGGDNIEGIGNPAQREDSSLRVREGLINYISSQSKQGKLINATRDERIIIL